MTAPESTADAYAECLAMRPVVDAAVAEVRAMERWIAVKSADYLTQRGAFVALEAAYEARVAAVRRWMAKHPEPAVEDGPGLFGGGDLEQA